jgi:ribulose-phosphate 3-epimerase
MQSGKNIEIAPSILAADFSRLGEQIDAVERGGADILHFDVMDGHFVPNITVGLPVLRSLARKTRLPIDAHLMITEPGRYAEQFVEAGAKMVSVHVEADPHLHRTLTSIKSAGAKAGVVLNPATPVSAVEEALFFADYVLVMSVNPGFGGQEFIAESVAKVRRLQQIIQDQKLAVRIEIDGGIDRSNIESVVEAGVEIIVAGSAIFGASNPENAVKELRSATIQWV